MSFLVPSAKYCIKIYLLFILTISFCFAHAENMTKCNPQFEWEVLDADIWVDLMQTENGKSGYENICTAGSLAISNSVNECLWL